MKGIIIKLVLIALIPITTAVVVGGYVVYNNQKSNQENNQVKNTKIVEEVKKTCTVTIDNKVSDIIVISVEEGKKIPEPNTPIKDGYTFKGWYVGNNKYDFKSSVTEDLLIEAVWEMNIIEDTNIINLIPVDTNQNTENKTQANTNQNTENKTQANTNQNTENKTQANTNQNTKNKTQANTPKELTTYKLTYNLNGGTAVNPETYTVESEDIILNQPTKTGYTFIGWTTQGRKLGKNVTIPKGTTGKFEFVADWEANKNTSYIVNHYLMNLDGQNYTLKDTDNLTGTTNEEITPAVKTYIGFTSPQVQTVTIKPDGTTVIDYKYTRNQYTLEIITDEGIESKYGDGTYYYGSKTQISVNTKKGYTFNKDNNEEINISYEYEIPAQDIKIFANTYKITYQLAYNLNGGECSNPETYTVESEDIILNQPTKTGYTFIGWTTQGRKLGKNVTIPKGTTGNFEFVVEWEANKNTSYIVNHYLMNLDGENYTLKDTDKLTGTTNAKVTPAVKTYTGFTLPEVQTVAIKPDGTTVIDYKYTRNKYKVELEGDGGINSLNGSGTYYYGTKVQISANVKNGYEIDKWSNNQSSLAFEYTIPASNTKLTAKTKLKTYTITYNLNGGTASNPTTYTIETESFTLNNPTKAGNTFAGWTKNGVNVGNTVTITKGTTGNLEFIANWTENTYIKYTKYTVNYYLMNINGQGYTLKETKNFTETATAIVTPAVKTYTGFTSPESQTVTGKADETEVIVDYYYTRNKYKVELEGDGGINSLNGSGTYYYEEKVQISANVKNGYEFDKWDNNQSNLAFEYTIPASDTKLTAKTKLKTYTITYNLNGGTASNPTTYTVETESFKLNNPTKDGNTFAGWTKNGVNVGNTVTITKGTTGNLKFIANWTENTYIKYTKYTVNHYLMNINGQGYKLQETGNFTEKANAKVTPVVKIYTGFTSPEAQTVTIKPDGTTVIDYYYTRNKYKVELEGDGGINSLNGSGTYYYEEKVQISANVKNGYEFDKWNNNQSNLAFEYTIPASNTKLTAKTKLKTYTITYNLNGGTASNPTTYTIETESFTLNNPTKDGNTFAGWTKNGVNVGNTVTITKGTTGNHEFIANWNTNSYDTKSYTVKFDTNGGTKIADSLVLYNNKVSQPNNPTRTGFQFGAWFKDSSLETLYDFNTPVTEDIILYAGWKIDIDKIIAYAFSNIKITSTKVAKEGHTINIYFSDNNIEAVTIGFELLDALNEITENEAFKNIFFRYNGKQFDYLNDEEGIVVPLRFIGWFAKGSWSGSVGINCTSGDFVGKEFEMEIVLKDGFISENDRKREKYIIKFANS